MKHTLHKSETRGFVDHGWLKARHTFSFASYYHPGRVRFGLLRVLNDDIIEPGMGFGTHPHDNMEIVTIPLTGELEHKDSMDNIEVIRPGEVQNMSAGSGITHSEYNHSEEKPVNLLQIWVFPKEKNITPRYDQKVFDPEVRKNKIQTIVTPEKSDDTLWINQDAVFSLADIDENNEVTYSLKFKENGIYIFVISGNAIAGGVELKSRDGIGIEEEKEIKIKAIKDSKILIIEVPLR